MRLDVQLSSFAGGELTPRLKGRTDHERYYIGCDALLNMVNLPQGGVARRPGTNYSADTFDQNNRPQLVPFIFSTVQAYMLEFGNLYIRVFMNGAPVLGGGGPGGQVIVTTPYAVADLSRLKWVQSADTLYLFHGKYPSQKLTRSSHTAWTLTPIDWKDGPYMPVDISPTTLTPSANTGSVTVTASATAGINGGAGFLATDVGRLIRYSSKLVAGSTGTPPVGASFGYLKITARADATHVTATVMPASGKPDAVTGIRPGTLDGITASNNWRLGRWSATTGYPYCGTFFQNRLYIGGSDQVPNGIWASVVGDFENMAPSDWDGAVLATSAFEWIISDDQVNPIYWLISAGSAQTAQLGIGTGGGENVLGASGTNAPVTPTNVQVYRETELTSSPLPVPRHIGKSVLFVNGPGLRLHEWTFDWQVNGYVGPDLAVFAEHLPKPAIVEMTYQRSPHGIIWARRSDGYLIGFTYLREQEVLAWHRHELGGEYFGGPPLVESLATIPAPDGSYDQVWFAVIRRIGGVVKRTIEVMTRYFDSVLVQQERAWFVDCGLRTPSVGPAFTLSCDFLDGTGRTFTATGAAFAPGDVGSIILYNGGVVKITAYTSPTVVTGDYIKPASRGGPAVAGTWFMAPQVASVSGLAHLNGATAAICGDGANYGRQTVAAGALALDPPAAFVTAGLPYLSRLVTMPLIPQRAADAAAGRIKRIDTLYLRFLESLSCDFGARITDDMTDDVSDTLEALEVRGAGTPMGWAPPLFTGLRRVNYPGGYDREGQVIAQTDGVLPLTVLALGVTADLSEGAVQ